MLKLLALIGALFLVPAADAVAQSKTVTVPGTLVFEHGENPDDPGNCSAIIFAQWSHDPQLKVISARAVVFPPEGERSTSKDAPFDDTYTWVLTYTAPAGTHRIAIGKSWGDGPVIPNDCSDANAVHLSQWPNHEARIELTVDTTAACTAAQKRVTAVSRDLLKARTKLAQASTSSSRRRAAAKVRSALAAKGRADAAAKAAC
jgi:hypothetical protein